MDIEEQLSLIGSEGFDSITMEAVSKAARFHGHICPGLATGISASMMFLRHRMRSKDEEIVAVVENDACGVDAIQALLGCTFGKGNLIFRDHGKSVYTFFDRNTGKGLRYSFRGMPSSDGDELAMDLFSKVRSGGASEDEVLRFQKLWAQRAARVLSAGKSLFTITESRDEIPEKARIFDSFTCPGCGEKVSSHRAVEIDGEMFCIQCSRVR
jgi:formylmethanofuran dehydrogenase subunit E